MAVLKHTSPTALPVAPRPNPSSTVPSASTRRAVALGSVQAESSCLLVISRLHSRQSCRRQRGLKVLREKITDAMKVAMKSQDKLRLSTLRLALLGLTKPKVHAP